MGCCGMISPLDLVELDDPALSAGAAGMEMGLDNPIFSGFGQFSLYILAFEKQSLGAVFHKRFRKTDKLM